MKLILAFAFSILSVGAFASERSVQDTIASIEFNENVKCDFIKSSFPICLGTRSFDPTRRTPTFSTCRYTSTYSCTGLRNIELKLKVKEYTDYRTEVRKTVVTKVKIK